MSDKQKALEAFGMSLSFCVIMWTFAPQAFGGWLRPFFLLKVELAAQRGYRRLALETSSDTS
jgi:hypothetical protein